MSALEPWPVGSTLLLSFLDDVMLYHRPDAPCLLSNQKPNRWDVRRRIGLGLPYVSVPVYLR